MGKVWRVALVGVCCLLVAAAVAAPVMLQVTQKEGEMEQAIGKYMKDAHNLDFELVPDEDGTGGLTLIMAMESDKVPDFGSYIKSAAYQQDDQGLVTERAVVVGLITQMKVAADKRPAVLEVMNRLNDELDFLHLYIDRHDEVSLRWMFVVTAEGLPAVSLYSALANMLPAWEEAQPQLAKALQ